MSKVQHFKEFSIVSGDIKIDFSMNRFKHQIERAQYVLDGQVMDSMVPFMPMVIGTFIGATRAASTAIQGTGQVYAAWGSQGRFLYEGKGMVDEKTGSPWARKDAKKVLVSQYNGKTNAHENLQYSRKTATDHWFDAAKKQDGKKWVKQVKEIAGGGK